MIESAQNPEGFSDDVVSSNGHAAKSISTNGLSKLSNKTLLTSGQCAKALGVAPRTIVKWMDSGILPGAFRLPNSQDRRIPKISFVMFCLNQGIPVMPSIQMDKVIVTYGDVRAIPPQIGFTVVRCRTYDTLNEYVGDLKRIIQFAIGPDVPLLEAQMIANCITRFQPTPIIFVNDDINKDTIPQSGREITYLSSLDLTDWYRSIFYLVNGKTQDRINHLGKKGGPKKPPALERLASNALLSSHDTTLGDV